MLSKYGVTYKILPQREYEVKINIDGKYKRTCIFDLSNVDTNEEIGIILSLSIEGYINQDNTQLNITKDENNNILKIPVNRNLSIIREDYYRTINLNEKEININLNRNDFHYVNVSLYENPYLVYKK